MVKKKTRGSVLHLPQLCGECLPTDEFEQLMAQKQAAEQHQWNFHQEECEEEHHQCEEEHYE